MGGAVSRISNTTSKAASQPRVRTGKNAKNARTTNTDPTRPAHGSKLEPDDAPFFMDMRELRKSGLVHLPAQESHNHRHLRAFQC